MIWYVWYIKMIYNKMYDMYEFLGMTEIVDIKGAAALIQYQKDLFKKVYH